MTRFALYVALHISAFPFVTCEPTISSSQLTRVGAIADRSPPSLHGAWRSIGWHFPKDAIGARSTKGKTSNAAWA